MTVQGRKALTELLDEARKDQRFAALIAQTETKEN